MSITEGLPTILFKHLLLTMPHTAEYRQREVKKKSVYISPYTEQNSEKLYYKIRVGRELAARIHHLGR